MTEPGRAWSEAWNEADEHVAQRLTRALYRFDCPSPQTVGEYQLDLLPPDERTRIAAHLLDCPHCAVELQQFRAFLRGPLVDGPALEQVLRETPQPSALGQLRRVVATLLRPTSELAYGGLRGTESGTGQTYRAGDLSITLGPGPRAQRGRGSLMGLVWSEAADAVLLAGQEVRLIGGAGAVSATVDELGNFAFDDLAPAAYHLELRLPDHVVVIEDVQVTG